MFDVLKADLLRNGGNTKGKILAVAFRGAQALQRLGRRNILLRIATLPGVALYKILVDYVHGTYLPPSTRVGPGFVIFHGCGLVINEHAVIGENVTVRHGVTIGARSDVGDDCPVIGNGVDIGLGAIIIGPIHIGDDAVIGAGAVVVKDVPAGAVVAGNPARIIRLREAAGPAPAAIG